jgi:hypothetical protein
VERRIGKAGASALGRTSETVEGAPDLPTFRLHRLSAQTLAGTLCAAASATVTKN